MFRTFPVSSINNPTTTTTSITSNTIGTGTKILDIPAGLGFHLGDRVQVVNNTSQYMVGSVQSYIGTAITVEVDDIKGSGTYASWTVSNSGGSSGVSTTSTTSLEIATGTQTLEVPNSGLSINKYDKIQAVHDATHYMTGTVQSYILNTIVATIDAIVGSGTYADWKVSSSNGGTGTATAIQISEDAGLGKTLTSDAAGNGRWQTSSGGIDVIGMQVFN